MIFSQQHQALTANNNKKATKKNQKSLLGCGCGGETEGVKGEREKEREKERGKRMREEIILSLE